MSEYLLHHYLDHWAKVQPEKSAVTSPGFRMTYRELYESSLRVAATLRTIGVRRQDRVAFCMGRSPHCIAAIMSILRTDAIYVPIDPQVPPKRFVKILENCTPVAIILDPQTAFTLMEPLQAFKQPPVPVVLGDGAAMDKGTDFPGNGHPPLCHNIDTDIAYILYTSGSTGDPKGVMISHLNVMNYIDWAVKAFSITQADVVLNTAPFQFDMSTFDIYCPLKAGATLAIATEKQLLFPGRLVEYAEREGVTIWKAISSILMYMAKTGALNSERMRALRTIIFSGEILPTRYLIEWMRCYPEKEFYNAYGPTEATGISTYHRVHAIPKDLHESIPIGKACENTEIFLLDENGAPVPAGETGELCIRGAGVSSGYWNDSLKTSAAFIPNPLSAICSDRIYRTGDLARQTKDGEYEFVGRKDSQVKFLGYRIEIGEIEKALRSLAGVCDAAVLLHNENGSETQGFVAFVEVEDSWKKDGILAELKQILPDYMLPRFVPMRSLPRTDRGKIDRLRLKQLLHEAETLAASR